MKKVLLDTVTGEVFDGFEARYRRWELQSAARRLLPTERISACFRARRKGQIGVSVFRRADSSTYFGGLVVCGAPWICPVCAAKISERRRGELLQAVSEWRGQGGHLAFVTFTVPHSTHSVAFDLVDTLLDLNRRMNSGRDRLSATIPGYVGQVRALEVTRGAAGWHPHLHVLLFLKDAPDLEALHRQLWASWRGLVVASGLGTPAESAFKVQDGSEAAKYASKWGIPEEMTKGHFKTAKSASGRTPFALLGDYLAGDQQAGALFREFAAAFKGRRQLRWSPGLRKLLGIGEEKTDEQEAATIDALDEKLATIMDRDWALILRHNLRALVLEVLRSGSNTDLRALLDSHRNPLDEALDLQHKERITS